MNTKNMNKKIIISTIVVLVILFIGAGVYVYYFFQNIQSRSLGNFPPDYSTIERDYSSQYKEFVDDIIKESNELVNDKTGFINYFDLGLAWKSLADRTNNVEHYKTALLVYEKGIEKTERKNPTLIHNAAKMAEYVGDYNLAENYYKEAIRVSPGDSSYYLSLIDLYQYKMNKSRAEILAVFDEALARVITNHDYVQRLKKSYEENK